VVKKGSNIVSSAFVGIPPPLSKVAILILTTAMAPGEIGVADDTIDLAFAITLGAIGIGAAIAIGLGGKDGAGREV